MRRFIKALIRTRRRRAVTALSMVVVGAFITLHAVHASSFPGEDTIFGALNFILAGMIDMFGRLTAIFVAMLVSVAQYNVFLHAPVVEQGWPIVRDLMNMVFIIALMIIAAGTVLRLQNYRYNQLLGRLIIMAILVNFSKFIAVFFLQFAQVVMITFVNAFRDAAFGNFTHMLGLDDALKFSQSNISVSDVRLATFITLLAGLIMMIVAFVVILAIVIVLFVRIVALWFLIILSPLAYALRVIRQTESQASRWWSEFGKYAASGPVLAFFLWITLAVTQTSCTGATGATSGSINPLTCDPAVKTQTDKIKPGLDTLFSGFIGNLFNLDRMVSFVVGIIFLMMGLSYAQKSSGAAGTFAGKVAAGGFGVAATVTGLNAIRDRTVAPIQGYLKDRQSRRNKAIQERAEGLGKIVDQTTRATVGQIGRVRAGVTSAGGAALRGGGRAAVGAVARGAGYIAGGEGGQAIKDWGERFGPTSPQELGRQIVGAGLQGLKEGTRGYRQTAQRIAETAARQQQRTDQEYDITNRSKAERESMVDNQSLNAQLRESAARSLLDNNMLQDDEFSRRAAALALNSVRNIPDQYRKTRDTLKNNNPALLLSAVYNNWRNGLQDAKLFADDIERGSINLEGINSQALAQMVNRLNDQQLANGRGLDGRLLDRTSDSDRKYAQTIAGNYLFKELATRAKTQKQLNSWLSPLDKQTRRSLGDGAYFDEDQLNSEQKKWVADEGYIGEAFHHYQRGPDGKPIYQRDPATGRITGVMTDYNKTAADDYAVNNAKKIVENAESDKLSLSSIGDKDVEALLHKTPGFDDESVEKMTKDLQVMGVYTKAVGEMVHDLKNPATAAALTARNGITADFSRNTPIGRQFINLIRSANVGAKGGYYEDSNGVEHNMLEETSTGYTTPALQAAATEQANTNMRVDGAKYKFITDDVANGAYSGTTARDEVIRRFHEQISVPGLAKLSESLTTAMLQNTVQAWKTGAAAAAVAGAAATPIETAMENKYERARWNEVLAPFR